MAQPDKDRAMPITQEKIIMAELLVDTGAILRNYRHYAAAGQVIPVLKANGYGLGAAELRELLRGEGVTLFACAAPEEALALAHPDSDLLLLSCVHDPAQLRALLQRRVILAVESLAQAQAIAALRMDARVHLAVDTGFGRFGFPCGQTAEMRRVFALDGLRVCGIFSHFRGASAAPFQFTRFSQVLLELEDCPVGLRHIAATHTADVPQYRLDAVRVGSGLTGCGCQELERAAQLQASICGLRRLRKGDRVGYGGTLLRRDSDVAVIDAGTAHGAFVYRYRGLRAFLGQRRPYVTVNGVNAPVLCPPGLTHTLVDVTGLACQLGDTVIVPHDLVLTDSRVPRRYTDG